MLIDEDANLPNQTALFRRFEPSNLRTALGMENIYLIVLDYSGISRVFMTTKDDDKEANRRAA